MKKVLLTMLRGAADCLGVRRKMAAPSKVITGSQESVIFLPHIPNHRDNNIMLSDTAENDHRHAIHGLTDRKCAARGMYTSSTSEE